MLATHDVTGLGSAPTPRKDNAATRQLAELQKRLCAADDLARACREVERQLQAIDESWCRQVLHKALAAWDAAEYAALSANDKWRGRVLK